jgi:exodeoxyribonuclease VII large subunit
LNPSSQLPADPTDAEVYTVSQLNREARRLLEAGLPMMWVAGEISNLAQPGSGHMYFSLKDDQAQVRCAMFRGANRSLGFSPADGDQVLVQARVSIYEPRGSYQLIVEKMEAAGEGLLRQRFEELKRKLSAEGLFDDLHKQSLPVIPRSIGIVTSPTGAAVRDILHILARRFPAASVIIYPTRVQGTEATAEIVRAIQQAEQRDECDALIIARGGGSLEDLWCFNEEAVARAIYACPIPVISGVGHEVDFSIADLVADVRAPTPSGAAEIIVPDRTELIRSFADIDRRATLSLKRQLNVRSVACSQMHGRLQRMHPGNILRQLQQRTDDLARQLGITIRTRLEVRRLGYAETRQRLRGATPLERVYRSIETTRTLQNSLSHALQRRIDGVKSRLAVAAANLNAVSPLATLERGYAIVRLADTAQVVSNVAQLKEGDRIEAQLAHGKLIASIDKLDKD